MFGILFRIERKALNVVHLLLRQKELEAQRSG